MITTNNLTKKYGEQTALDNLNLNVKEGEIYCLLGANGAGKTTTINLLLGFIEPTSGNAFINQLDVQQNPKATKHFLAYIPENLMLYPSLNRCRELGLFFWNWGETTINCHSKGFFGRIRLTARSF